MCDGLQYHNFYNHDNLARNYDRQVQRTDDPIREGYEQVLDWVVAEANIDADTDVLELGSGTGNLTQRIASCASLVCVDISTEMEACFSAAAKARMPRLGPARSRAALRVDSGLMKSVTVSGLIRQTCIVSSTPVFAGRRPLSP